MHATQTSNVSVSGSPPSFSDRLRLSLPAALFLAFSAAAALGRGHYYLTHGDDVLELWCDRVATLSQLWHIERFASLAVDPFLNHAVIHGLIRLVGIDTPVLLLPALLGFLLMQVCLFFFVRRIASANTAVFALALPALSPVKEYVGTVRPYGLLLGFFGLAMVAWQAAAYKPVRRRMALGLLSLSIALAVNTHFYGVLILVPLFAAELVRAFQNRRIDLPMLLSFAAGTAGIIFVVPFLQAAAVFREYYPTKPIALQTIFQTYSFILTGVSQFSARVNHLLCIVFVGAFALVLWSCLARRRANSMRRHIAEFAFLIALAALPFVGFFLGRLSTHAMEPRYFLGSLIALSALVSIALDPLLRRPIIGQPLLFALFLCIAATSILNIRAERQRNLGETASTRMSPEVRAAFMATPTQLLYTQDVDLFGFLVLHDPDADTTARLTLVYSRDDEMHFNGSAASALVCSNLRSFTTYRIVPYESIQAEPGTHIFVINDGGWNWIQNAFAHDHLPVKSIGYFLGSRVLSVEFPSGTSARTTP